MITKELAMSLHVRQELWHNFVADKNGTPLRARVTGKCRTWKRTPDRFCVPMTFDLKDHFYIDTNWGGSRDSSPANWSLPERWPIERFWEDAQS